MNGTPMVQTVTLRYVPIEVLRELIEDWEQDRDSEPGYDAGVERGLEHAAEALREVLGEPLEISVSTRKYLAYARRRAASSAGEPS